MRPSLYHPSSLNERGSEVSIARYCSNFRPLQSARVDFPLSVTQPLGDNSNGEIKEQILYGQILVGGLRYCGHSQGRDIRKRERRKSARVDCTIVPMFFHGLPHTAGMDPPECRSCSLHCAEHVQERLLAQATAAITK